MDYWTYPAEAENGRTLLLTGRDGLDKYRLSGKYNYRIIASWDYNALPDGMPCDEDARLMEQATDAFEAATTKDKAAVLTGIYTGDGRRDWVFYTKSLHLFQALFNRALLPLDPMPLVIEAAEDPAWEEYLEMKANSYVPPEKN